MLVQSFKYTIAVGISAVLIGCGGGGGSATPSVSKFDSAKPLNLRNLNEDDTKIITGSKSTSSLSRSLQNNETNSNDELASKLGNLIFKNVKLALKQNKISARAITDHGSYVISEDTEQGNISGSVYYYFNIDKSTGNFNGTMKYTNYKNSSSNSCGQNQIDEVNGNLSVSGKYDINNDEIDYIAMNASSDLSVGNGIVFNKGFNLRLDYLSNDRYRFTLNGEAQENSDNYGFKDYKLFTYTDSQYIYSYPESGNIYIFDNNVNGYFWVYTSYNHSSTPTKKDICSDTFYSGKEKYKGDNSSLTFEIDSTNHYTVDIDEGNDGSIDKSFSGNL